MKTEEEKERMTPGEKLAYLDKEIKCVTELLDSSELLGKGRLKDQDGKIANGPRWGDSSSEIFNRMRSDLLEKREQLLAFRHVHLDKNPPPPDGSIRCPHCGYDGEFGEDNPTGMGFRLLEPILQPRVVLSYQAGKMELSDPDESYDPFDTIASPGHLTYIDGPDNSDKVELEIRKLLRGRFVFVCGDTDCLQYFDASEFMYMTNVDYPGVRPWKTTWRMTAKERAEGKGEERK